MKKYLIISLLFIALINSGAGCGSNSDQIIAPVAPNYLGLWGTNEDGCTGDSGSMNEETLEITEGKIVFLQPELTPTNCQALRTANHGLKAEYSYTVEKDIIKITPKGTLQKLSGGILTEIVAADKAVAAAQRFAEQLFNKELSSKFTCDGKNLKFETFGNPSYVKRK